MFAWRQLYRQGLLKPAASTGSSPLLLVKVGTPTVLPAERARRLPRETVVAVRTSPGIDITLANGHSILVHGRIDAKARARVIDLLVRQ